MDLRGYHVDCGCYGLLGYSDFFSFCVFGTMRGCFSSTNAYCGHDVIEKAVLGLLALLFILLNVAHQQRSVLISISNTITKYENRELLSRCENTMKSIRVYGEVAICSGCMLTLMYMALMTSDQIKYLLIPVLFLSVFFIVMLFVQFTTKVKPTKVRGERALRFSLIALAVTVALICIVAMISDNSKYFLYLKLLFSLVHAICFVFNYL